MTVVVISIPSGRTRGRPYQKVVSGHGLISYGRWHNSTTIALQNNFSASLSNNALSTRVGSFVWDMDCILGNLAQDMMTSSNGNIFRVTGHLCGEFTGHRWIHGTKARTRSFDVFFDMRMNKRLSKHWWGRWFETPSRPLWRHCNVFCEMLGAFVW